MTLPPADPFLPFPPQPFHQAYPTYLTYPTYPSCALLFERQHLWDIEREGEHPQADAGVRHHEYQHR